MTAMTQSTANDLIPVQPVERPILCNPYEEPNKHWLYNRETGAAECMEGRREAGYYFKTERTGSAQRSLFAEEQREDLPLINLLRSDVRRWRQDGKYPGASPVTRELLN
jgi:type III restriction enzyme